MIAENDFLIPEWPDTLLDVDVVQSRFILEFQSACCLQPADFLGLGRALRVAGRQLFDAQATLADSQWRALFQPTLSDDPVALRKFQKPAPPFVIKIPILRPESFAAGDQIALEVLFVGTGTTLISGFLRSLVHLGSLGLTAGEGRFDVIELHSNGPGASDGLNWRQGEPYDALSCPVLSMSWLLQKERLEERIRLNFNTPTRLMVAGKPLRKPTLQQIFPFMLRRVTSMLYTHCRLEMIDEPVKLLEQVPQVEVIETRLSWSDWRSLSGRKGLSVGGFVGDIVLAGQALESIYWVFVVASLFGVGKGAAYGGGHFKVSS